MSIVDHWPVNCFTHNPRWLCCTQVYNHVLSSVCDQLIWKISRMNVSDTVSCIGWQYHSYKRISRSKLCLSLWISNGNPNYQNHGYETEAWIWDNTRLYNAFKTYISITSTSNVAISNSREKSEAPFLLILFLLIWL